MKNIASFYAALSLLSKVNVSSYSIAKDVQDQYLRFCSCIEAEKYRTNLFQQKDFVENNNIELV